MIIKLTNHDKEFYPFVGPFLSRRVIVNELGYPIFDDDGKVWFVSIENNKVVGFCAALPAEKHISFCSDYVLPDKRNDGIYSNLFARRLQDYADAPRIKATVTNDSLCVYLDNGFHEVGKAGKFTKVERILA